MSRRLPEWTLRVRFAVSDEILVLFGPSGAGKTTTLRLVAGLERPDAGEIRLGGRVLCARQPPVWVPPRDRRCGMVFQDAMLFPHLNVRANILYGARGGGEAVRVRLERLLETFGIGRLTGRFPAELSGGEAQRVALARALMTEPDVLLLDEPFSALDRDTRAAVQEEVLAAHRTWRIPFVLVTHDREDAERMGDRTVLLRRGQQVEESAPAPHAPSHDPR